MNRVTPPSPIRAFASTVVLAVMAGVGIAVVVGGLSYLVVGYVLESRRSDEATLPTAGDALSRVDVWVGERTDAVVLLRTLTHDSQSPRSEDVLVGREVFPDGRDVRFAVLWIFNYADEGDLVFDRLTHLLSVGGVPAIDLPAALESAKRTRSDVGVFLRAYSAHSVRVSVPARAFRRVLVALPVEVELDSASSVTLTEFGIEMKRRSVQRYRLENYLANPGDRGALLRGAL